MGKFFEELAKKLAERWMALLVLPGALFILLAALALWQGQRLALDWTRARQGLDAVTALRLQVGGQVTAVLALLLASAGIGFAVQGLAGLTRAVWLGRWPGPVRRLRAAARRRRWLSLVEKRAAVDRDDPDRQAKVDRFAERANRIAMAEPGRPTWMGDRVHAVEQVALNRFGVDLAFGWSRLWLVLPDTVRAEITAAESTFAAAVATGTWSLPYLVLAAWWWPAAVIGLVFGATGWAKGRHAIAELTVLSEAAVDLHGRTLARALGVGDQEETGVLTIDQGREITALVRKGR
ncbi:hypothetical protein V5P93_004214 [Actinokineospora auranticolor]|uniref:Uncharacterized protein n=1 Tax=Actinokineospora auranticolor TaxID=155976 RepID=A0A2S6GIQ8_9PSEU|nr:hypothetical protein [Actinokineospora auranticolor]PPK65041.1 hypothetical protein CLV40_11684 [Actinokineospora auranticolor]